MKPNHEAGADRILSKAHKAKEREWDRVLLAEDFFAPRKEEDGTLALPPEEIRLLYVAMTRVQHEV